MNDEPGTPPTVPPTSRLKWSDAPDLSPEEREIVERLKAAAEAMLAIPEDQKTPFANPDKFHGPIGFSDAELAAIARCADFTALVGRYFDQLLQAYSFSLADCLSLRDSRELIALYQSPGARLLAEFSDGVFSILLGSPDAPFPGPNEAGHDGQHGWYTVCLLAEFMGGRRIRDGKIDQYRFEADLFARWADRLLPLFDSAHDQGWRVDFAEFFNRGSHGLL